MKNHFAMAFPTRFALVLLSSATITSAQPASNLPPAAPGTQPAAQPAPLAQRQQAVAGNVSPILRALTPEQRTQMRQAMEANHEQTEELQEQIRAARKELLELQLAEKLDEAAFRTKSAEIIKAQAEVELFNARAFAKVRPSLTAEQLEQIRGELNRQSRRYGGPEARPGVFPQGAPATPPLHRPLPGVDKVVPPSLQTSTNSPVK
jgi:Spy/CpxP family protein refolding chaperone